MKWKRTPAPPEETDLFFRQSSGTRKRLGNNFTFYAHNLATDHSPILWFHGFISQRFIRLLLKTPPRLPSAQLFMKSLSDCITWSKIIWSSKSVTQQPQLREKEKGRNQFLFFSLSSELGRSCTRYPILRFQFKNYVFGSLVWEFVVWTGLATCITSRELKSTECRKQKTRGFPSNTNRD